MAYVDYKEMLGTARQKFIDGDYKIAESLLQQILLINNRIPEVFHMLATIYYDRSQFSKSIKHFKRAIEIDPTYTDASIGLSIILNDLGRYEEGKKVFNEAQDILKKKSSRQSDPFIDGKLAEKHIEIGDLYFQFSRWDESLEQYYKAYRMSQAPEIKMKIIDTYLKKGDGDKSIEELKTYIKDYPQDLKAQVLLGKVFYDFNRVPDAVDQWEKVLFRDPENEDAKKLLKVTQNTSQTTL
jgi:tetratricopeptide (TPR) repeat protein